MLKIGSFVFCIDTTGVYKVKIIKAYVRCLDQQVKIGDAVLVVIKIVNPRTRFFKDERIKFKFRRGTIHKAVVVHTVKKYKRLNRTYIGFPANAVVLVSNARIPLGKRIKLGIPREIAKMYPAIGSIAPYLY